MRSVLHKHEFEIASNQFETIKLVTSFVGDTDYGDLSVTQQLVVNGGSVQLSFDTEAPFNPNILRRLADELHEARTVAKEKLHETIIEKRNKIDRTMSKLTPEDKELLGLTLNDNQKKKQTAIYHPASSERLVKSDNPCC